MEDLSMFISEDSNILEKLQTETPIIYATFDDFLNLPLNEEYKKKSTKKKIGVEESKNE